MNANMLDFYSLKYNSIITLLSYQFRNFYNKHKRTQGCLDRINSKTIDSFQKGKTFL